MANSPQYLPSDWVDDQVMDVMFSPFRGSRDLNPHSWDSKLNFWTDLFRAHCIHSKTFIIDSKSLPYTFQRKGKLPVCLDVVLQELKKQGRLQTIADFHNSVNTSWASWGYGILVKKPAAWTYDLLVKKPIQWTASKVFGSQSEANQEMVEKYVDVQLVKEMATAVLQCHRRGMQNELTDSMLEYRQLLALCKDVCPDPQCLQLAVLQLCKEVKCSVTEVSSTEKIVKFAHPNENKVVAATENDLRIFRIKNSQEVLEKQINKLTDEMQQCRIEAKQNLAEGRKSSAKNCLRRKKRLEQVRDSKDQALDNLQHMITLIQQIDSNKMIVDAYKSGNEVFKEMQRRYGLTPDMIDDAMAEITEVKEMSDEINASMSQPIDPLEPSMDDLEQELDLILAGGDLPGDLQADLPSPPKREPAMPHQEMVDVLCRMKVSTDDVELPEPPQFDPATPPPPTAAAAAAAGNTKEPTSPQML